MDLQTVLLDLQKRIRKYVKSGQAETISETETRHLLIDPLIVALGWDINDLECVRQAWRGSKSYGEQKEADYALFLRGKEKPSVIIEAKRFSANLEKDKTLTQTLYYAYLNKVEWCILTNGHQVIVYDAFSRDPSRDRLLFDPIDINSLSTCEGITIERASALLQMFTPEGLESNRPSLFRDTYRLRSRVVNCLEKMIKDPDRSLVSLIHKRLDKEYKPKRISACLKGLILKEGDEEIQVRETKKDRRLKKRQPKRPPRPGSKRAERLERWKRLNTIVCPAREDGFQSEFIGKNRWYAIRLNARRIPFVKYIAIYRTRPISAVTHYGEVKSIKHWRNSAKYVVRLKAAAKKIKPIPLNKNPDERAVIPQCPQFTSMDALRSAKTLDDCLGKFNK